MSEQILCNELINNINIEKGDRMAVLAIENNHGTQRVLRIIYHSELNNLIVDTSGSGLFFDSETCKYKIMNQYSSYCPPYVTYFLSRKNIEKFAWSCAFWAKVYSEDADTVTRAAAAAAADYAYDATRAADYAAAAADATRAAADTTRAAVYAYDAAASAADYAAAAAAYTVAAEKERQKAFLEKLLRKELKKK